MAVLGVAVLAAWTAFQPLRAQHAGDEAFRRLDLGQRGAALEIAGIAVRRDPLSVDALFDRSAIESALGLRTAAERTLEQAVELQPANAEAWRRLGEYRALVLARPNSALAPLRAAYYLDPRSPETEAAFLLVRRQLATR